MFAQVFRMRLNPQTGGRIVLASDGLWDGFADPGKCDPAEIHARIEKVSRGTKALGWAAVLYASRELNLREADRGEECRKRVLGSHVSGPSSSTRHETELSSDCAGCDESLPSACLAPHRELRAHFAADTQRFTVAPPISNPDPDPPTHRRSRPCAGWTTRRRWRR